MRDWQNDAPRMIAAIHKAIPDATPDEVRKALRKEAWHFHGGTSWGKRVWSKHCRIYMSKLTGNGHYSGNGKATEWPADIAFPFRAAITKATSTKEMTVANSPSWVREIRCIVEGAEAQGAIGVYVFVECPTFHAAQRWYYKECPADKPLVEWLGENISGHLNWEWRSPKATPEDRGDTNG